MSYEATLVTFLFYPNIPICKGQHRRPRDNGLADLCTPASPSLAGHPSTAGVPDSPTGAPRRAMRKRGHAPALALSPPESKILTPRAFQALRSWTARAGGAGLSSACGGDRGGSPTRGRVWPRAFTQVELPAATRAGQFRWSLVEIDWHATLPVADHLTRYRRPYSTPAYRSSLNCAMLP